MLELVKYCKLQNITLNPCVKSSTLHTFFRLGFLRFCNACNVYATQNSILGFVNEISYLQICNVYATYMQRMTANCNATQRDPYKGALHVRCTEKLQRQQGEK